MKIGIQSWGSLGDHVPFFALAQELREQDYEVIWVVASVGDFDLLEKAQAIGIEVVHISESKLNSDGKVFPEIGPLSPGAIINAMYLPYVSYLIETAEFLCVNCDIVIRHFADFAIQIMAEKYNKPEISVSLSHAFIPTKNYPPSIMRFRFPAFSKRLNSTAWVMLRQAFNKRLLGTVNEWRNKFELLPLDDFLTQVWMAKRLNLVAVSETICGNPLDWETKNKVCGFFSMPASKSHWEMSDDLKNFIDKGSAPIFITMGSSTPKDECDALDELMYYCAKIAKLAGCRAIIQTTHPNSKNFIRSDNLFYTGRVPHLEVFSHCSAVIHHGGAGSVQSACLAGVPSIVIAGHSEQLFWGIALEKLGVSPPAQQHQNADAVKTAKKVKRVLADKQMSSKAKQVSQAMRQDNGVKYAVKQVEEYWRDWVTEQAVLN